MKFKKTFLSIVLFSLSIPAIASCGNKAKIDEGRVAILNSYVTYDETNKNYTYSFTEAYPYFKAETTTNDLVCFNASKIEDDPDFKEENLNDINYFKKFAVNTSNLEVGPDLNSLNFTFEGNDDDIFGCIVLDNATKDKIFIYSNIEEPYGVTKQRLIQNDFEDKYLRREGPQWVSETELDFLTYFDKITSDEIFTEKQPSFSISPAVIAKIVESVKKVVGFVYEKYKEATTPSIEDVYAKLKVVEDNITKITNILEKNNSLITQYYTDMIFQEEKNAIKILETNINIFRQDYIYKLEAFASDIGMDLADKFKEFVNKNQTLTIYYNETDKENPIAYFEEPEGEEVEVNKYELTISDWSKSKEFLASHDNIPEKGFLEAIKVDIINKINQEQRQLPVSDARFTEDLLSIIEVGFLKEYFNKNDKQKAKDIGQLVIDTSKAIKDHVAEEYIERAQYVYNFASEAKDYIKDINSYLLFTLDKFASLATLASHLAELSNRQEIGENYDAARNAIVSEYIKQTEVPDKYSYVAKSVIEGKTIEVETSSKASSLTEYQGSIKFFNTYYSGPEEERRLEITREMAESSMLQSKDLLMIAKRYQVLNNSAGDDSMQYDFITYLVKRGIYPSFQADEITGPNRFFISYSDSLFGRAMDNYTDGNLDLYIKDRNYGAFGKDTFNDVKNGQTTKYGQKNSSDSKNHWSGTKAVSDIIDATSGDFKAGQTLAAIARYKTDGKLFNIGARNYSFVDALPQHMFFSLFKSKQ